MRSEKFRMGRWHCYLLMLLHQAPRLAVILALVVTALAVGGFLISPWGGIAAIGVDVFVVVMAMSFVIMAFGINSITGVNMTEHTLSSEANDVKVEFEEGLSVEIAKTDIRRYHIYPGGVIVPVEGKRKGWLWVPPGAFENDALFQSFLKSLYTEQTLNQNTDESNTEQKQKLLLHDGDGGSRL